MHRICIYEHFENQSKTTNGRALRRWRTQHKLFIINFYFMYPCSHIPTVLCIDLHKGLLSAFDIYARSTFSYDCKSSPSSSSAIYLRFLAIFYCTFALCVLCMDMFCWKPKHLVLLACRALNIRIDLIYSFRWLRHAERKRYIRIYKLKKIIKLIGTTDTYVLHIDSQVIYRSFHE